MNTALLTEAEYQATFVDPMRDIYGVQRDVIDVWPYFDSIPAADFSPFLFADASVERVYRSGNDVTDHVLIPTTTKNVYLVLVISLKEERVVGHHLLNLNEKYGLPTPPSLREPT